MAFPLRMDAGRTPAEQSIKKANAVLDSKKGSPSACCVRQPSPNLYTKLPFDTVKDLAPVVMVGTLPLLLVIQPCPPRT
jgi:hypothetical protein